MIFIITNEKHSPTLRQNNRYNYKRNKHYCTTVSLSKNSTNQEQFKEIQVEIKITRVAANKITTILQQRQF